MISLNQISNCLDKIYLYEMPLILSSQYSGHKKCFICFNKRKYKKIQVKRLHRIKKSDFVYSFIHHHIYLKIGLRCCSQHLEKDGSLKIDQYQKIPTKYTETSNDTFFMLTSLKQACLQPKINFIDEFKSIETLSEKTCLEWTGWPKKKFLQFSDYLTSINESAGRNKYQLIALYRIWIRKGVDQSILSNFIANTSQQRISEYLSSIRNAIYKDFTPYFIGAKSKSRGFFIEQNTETAKTLFRLKDEDLAVVIDGTHTQIGKSANNEVQYNSYGEKKKGVHIKPYIVCCTNGYIIDCYFPFQANLNDAMILKKILDSDYKLRELLIEEKSLLLLDRGNFLCIKDFSHFLFKL